MSIPKISIRHQTIHNITDDFILGNIVSFTLEDILNYKENKKQFDVIDRTNNLEKNGFKFLEDLLGNSYYTINIYRANSSICSILFTICQQFSLLKSATQIDDFIYKFRIQMGIDIVEKGYHKKLNLLAQKIRRKTVEEIFLRNPENAKIQYDLDKIPEINMILKYICLRFNIGLTIISVDKSYRTLCHFPNRFNIIILENNSHYMPLCNKESDMYLYSTEILEGLINKLKRDNKILKNIKEYKVAELKDLAIRYGLEYSSKKKDELYALLEEKLKYKE